MQRVVRLDGDLPRRLATAGDAVGWRARMLQEGVLLDLGVRVEGEAAEVRALLAALQDDLAALHTLEERRDALAHAHPYVTGGPPRALLVVVGAVVVVLVQALGFLLAAVAAVLGFGALAIVGLAVYLRQDAARREAHTTAASAHALLRVRMRATAEALCRKRFDVEIGGVRVVSGG